jgi:hypothetical protein
MLEADGRSLTHVGTLLQITQALFKAPWKYKCTNFGSRVSFHSSGIYSACKMTSYRGTSPGFGRRGSWRGNDSHSRAENRQPPALTPPRPLGPTIDSINSKTLLIEEDAPTVQDVEYVASYNWLDGRSPIILVPGQYLIFCFIPIDI